MQNGVQTGLAWTNRGQLDTLLTQKTGAAVHLNLDYLYRDDGRIQETANLQDSSKTEKYTYDELNRLLTAQRGPDATPAWKWSYEYDRFGNRWNKTLLAGTGTEHTLSFNYPDNRITTAAYGYDNSGNLAAAGTGTSFVYNAESFMTSATTSPGAGTYVVDAQGRRVKKTVSGAITHYFYSGSEIISELSGSAWTDYIFFAGQRIVKQTGTTITTATFLHTDRLGSVRRCTDSTGVQNGTCDYEPFGEGQSAAGCTVPSNFRFAGMLWDPESNLNHTWFRQYDSAQGRWMGADPIEGSSESPRTLNRYGYVINDPENLTDPLGLFCYFGEKMDETIRDEETCRNKGGRWVSTIWIINDSGTSTTITTTNTTIGQCYDVYVDGDYSYSTCDWPSSSSNGGGLGGSSGTQVPGQPQAEEPSRLATCAKAYYGIGTIASRATITAAGAPVPKPLLGLPRVGGSSYFTTLPSTLSLGQGTIASGNWLRALGRSALPVFVATVAIDVAAIGICTFIDQ